MEPSHGETQWFPFHEIDKCEHTLDLYLVALLPPPEGYTWTVVYVVSAELFLEWGSCLLIDIES